MTIKETIKVTLTAKRIADFRCPDNKSQEIMWDANTPNLGVKIRPRGKPAFIYQGSLEGKSKQMVIGSALTWKIPEAQAEARRLQVLVDKKIDPKEEREANLAASAKARAEKLKVEVTVGDVWDVYVQRGSGKKGRAWSETYKKNLRAAMKAGGEKYPRCGERRTVSGPLFYLRDVPLAELDDDMLANIIGDELERMGERGSDGESKNPRGYAAIKNAVEWLSGMYRWASSRTEYKKLIRGNPARSTTVQDSLPSQAGARRLDFVEVPQLEKFFQALAKMPNRTMAGYITGLMITGARRKELAKLKWEHIDFDLMKYTIADKTKSNLERIRTLPLTPMFERVVSSMPRVEDNPYVFAAPRSRLGYVQDARKALAPVTKFAKIAHLTPHGLRRTFSLLGEAAKLPAGAIEQAMGHAVAGMDEHYKPRRIEMLRVVMRHLENYVIEHAGLPADQAPVADLAEPTAA